MTKVEIIQETVAYYSEDTQRRGLNSDGRCSYLTKGGQKCAVGRCLLPTVVEKAARFWSVNELAHMLVDGILDNALIERYRGHSNVFWQDLQLLHDNQDFWNAEGITKAGEEQVEVLLITHKN